MQGNFLGTDISGANGLGNSLNGVTLSSTNFNTIGGTTVAFGNLLSGNGGSGVSILNGSTGNLIEANEIGTDLSGGTSVPNQDNGVLIANATGNTVGGLTSSPGSDVGNVISGNNGNGVAINDSGKGTSAGNLIAGNEIGTDALGIKSVSNRADGVRINNAYGNTIGGTDVMARNVISGNNGNGVNLVAVGPNSPINNWVMGNYVGTALNGVDAVANDGNGVSLDHSNQNLVANNVLSFNDQSGAKLSNSATGNTVRMNTIAGNAGGGVGIDDAQTNVVDSNTITGNLGVGISITNPTATANSIRGNVIDGNLGTGVSLILAPGNQVFANLIGTDLSGKAAGNQQSGILINNAANTTIGCSEHPGERRLGKHARAT